MFQATDPPALVRAQPGRVGWCPTCLEPLRPKCGSTVAWHWSHVNGSDCDTWSEPVSEWHLGWQSEVPPERREVTIRKVHRADMVTPSGSAVEVQHSSLSADEIREREAFYGLGMTWIWDAQEAFYSDRLNLRPRPDGKASFRWKHPRKTLAACRRRTLLDLDGKSLLMLDRIYLDTPCGGLGRVVSRDQVVRRLLNRELS